jgi:methyl-accepting chemotaxis protein
MLKNATMTTRLFTGFAVVIVLLVAVAAVGIINLHSMNNQVDQLANNRVPQVIAAGKWEAAVLRSARHMQTVFVLTDPAEISEELKAIRENRKEQLAMQGQVRELASARQAQAVLAEVDNARKAYLESENDFVQFAEAGKMEDAKTTLLVRLRPAAATYIGAINKLETALSAEARDMSRQSAAAYAGSITAVILVSLLCVAAATVVAMMISNGLRRQLGGEPAYATSVVRKVASGDLTVQVRLAEGDTRSLLFATREMISNLRNMVGEAAKGARSVADTSAQIAQGNLDLSQRTEEQASTLQDAAHSMEELTSTVAQNAQNAREASKLAATASDTARQGGQAVDEVVTTMDEILDSSKKISDIIGVIDGIAFQTNILALNAAVEAARAGDQGRGFAVVAAEVRNLAHRTTAAAKEIKGLISDSTQKVQAGSSRVDAAGHTMVGIVLSVQKVTELIQEIAAASGEQSSRIGQVSTAVMQMDRVVQQNAALVEEATAATESMKEQAASLLDMVSRFRLDESDPAASTTGLPPSGPAPIEVRPSSKLPAPYLAALMNATGRKQAANR